MVNVMTEPERKRFWTLVREHNVRLEEQKSYLAEVVKAGKEVNVNVLRRFEKQ